MTAKKTQNRIRRHARVRAKIKGTTARPRVSVFRSNQHLFVQVINDEVGKTLLSSKVVAARTKKGSAAVKKPLAGNKTEQSSTIGKALGEQMVAAGIKEIVFDRGGFKYHGRVKALADGLRAAGLKF